MRRKPTLILLSAIAFILLSIAMPFYTFAQEEWSSPVQIFGNEDYNCSNVDLIAVSDNGTSNIWTAYERYSDSVSTAIYIQEILNNGEPIEILKEDSIHYLHPRFFVNWNFYQGDTLFYLFYETIQNGIQNLNYIKYLTSGEILGPFPFFQTSTDDHYLEISHDEQKTVWISDGNLLLSVFISSSNNYGFSNPIIVDSGNCINPKKTSWGNIYYIKRTDSTSVLFRAEDMGGYFEKEVVYDEGFAKNLKRDALGMELVTWTGKNNNDDQWHLFTFEPYGSGEYIEHYLPKETPYDAGICSFLIGVKSSLDWNMFYLAFPYDSLGYEELYMNPDPFNTNYSSFTNLQSICRNPNSFFGEPAGYSCFYAYFVWETLVNDKWQLYYSKTLECIGGVDEREPGISFIRVNPNPFTEKININYSLDQGANVRIDILDVVGKPVFNILDEFQIQGLHKINWIADNNLDNGVYFIRLQNGQRTYVQKAIKAN